MAPSVQLVLIDWTRVPKPTWFGLTPPKAAPELSAVPPERVWLKLEAKCTLEDLYAVVFVFEMLFPITSNQVLLDCNPEIALYISLKPIIILLRVFLTEQSARLFASGFL